MVKGTAGIWADAVSGCIVRVDMKASCEMPYLLYPDCVLLPMEECFPSLTSTMRGATKDKAAVRSRPVLRLPGRRGSCRLPVQRSTRLRISWARNELRWLGSRAGQAVSAQHFSVNS